MEPTPNKHGGNRPGAGRKDPVTKTSINVTLDTDLVNWLDNLGSKRSAQLNKIVRAHKNRIDQLIAEADELQERYELLKKKPAC